MPKSDMTICTIGREPSICRMMWPGGCSECGFNRSEAQRRTKLLRRYGLSTRADGVQFLDISRGERGQKEAAEDAELLCSHPDEGADGQAD